MDTPRPPARAPLPQHLFSPYTNVLYPYRRLNPLQHLRTHRPLASSLNRFLYLAFRLNHSPLNRLLHNLRESLCQAICLLRHLHEPT